MIVKIEQQRNDAVGIRQLNWGTYTTKKAANKPPKAPKAPKESKKSKKVSEDNQDQADADASAAKSMNKKRSKYVMAEKGEMADHVTRSKKNKKAVVEEMVEQVPSEENTEESVPEEESPRNGVMQDEEDVPEEEDEAPVPKRGFFSRILG